MKQEDRNAIIEKLKALLKNNDVEMQHYESDAILCEVLEKLGESEIVSIYKQIPKYYA